MSTKKKSKAPVASMAWFEIPADNTKRAKKFYSAMFGWKITPFPGTDDYSHIDTGGADASPDGGLMKRTHPGHTITTYFFVASVNRGMAKVKRLGGKICKPRTAVPHMGYYAICLDTEKNAFALWEVNPKAR
jgi:uncharacterized protein